MNTEAAIVEFVKKNFSFLTSLDFERDRFKLILRQHFYEKHNKKFGMPSLKDICIGLVGYQIKRGIVPEEVKKQVRDFPIFTNLGEQNRQELINIIENKKYTSSLTPKIIETIKAANAFEAVKEHLGEKIDTHHQEKIEKLNKEIEQKRQEYYSLPSIIEDELIPEPDYCPEVEDVKPWWERFYLRANPFARKDGLSSINKELYDSVVVKTKPFKDILSAINRNLDCAFNTGYLLIGNFGFGKTTFMDYLSYYLIHKNVLPLRITCGKSFPDSSGFIDNFYIKLRECLKNEVNVRNPQIQLKLNDCEIEGQLIELFREVSSTKAGIIVFLDDYHKHRSAFLQIYDFMGTLQIIKDRLTRENMKVGFFVSGLPEWKQELPRNPQMSGFFDSGFIEMPEITPESVCEVFNCRIKAFCYDKYPRELQLAFVKKIFQEVTGSSGYRDYLTRIITELENNNFAIVNTPIELTDDELAKVRSNIERNKALYSAFDKLVFGSKFKQYTSEQVARCLELVVHTSLQQGVAETDILFIKNKHYFQRLNELHFLQKQKIDPKTFKWIIHRQFQETFNIIQKDFNLSISDYLLKIYGGRNYLRNSAKLNISKQNTSSIVRNFLNCTSMDISKSAKDSLDLAFRMFDSVEMGSVNYNLRPELIDHAWQAIDYLSRALFEIDGSHRLFQNANISDLQQKWRLHWYDNESLEEFFRRHHDYQVDQNRRHYELVIKQVKDAFLAIAECLKEITEDICNPKTANAGFFHDVLKHTKEECDIFRLAKEAYFSAARDSHFGYVEKITDYLEDRFRMFFYVTTNLAFGSKNYFEHVPAADKKYAYKNISNRPCYSSIANYFTALTRPQFRNMFTTGGPIKNMILDGMSMPWLTSDWELFFNIFIEENIATSHKLKDTYSPQDREKYISYCKMAEQLTGTINHTISLLINRHAFFTQIGDDQNDGDVLYNFVFRFKNRAEAPKDRKLNGTENFIPDKHLLEAHVLSSDVLYKVRTCIQDKLVANNFYVEDLLAVEYIVNHYDVTYTEFICSLLQLAFYAQKIIVVPWHGSSVLIKSK